MHATTVVGVTGSSGKTTTTRLIHSVLKQKLRGTASAKSHNNTLGVCLTILNAPTDGEYLVGELGSSAPGEIGALCELIRPSIGVVTSFAWHAGQIALTAKLLPDTPVKTMRFEYWKTEPD